MQEPGSIFIKIFFKMAARLLPVLVAALLIHSSHQQGKKRLITSCLLYKVANSSQYSIKINLNKLQGYPKVKTTLKLERRYTLIFEICMKLFVLSAYISIYLSIYLSTYPPTYVCMCLYMGVYIYVSTCIFIYISMYLSIHLSIDPSIY